MSKSYWESEVYERPPLVGLERVNTKHIFGWLRTTMPVVGSKIDWTSAPGNHCHLQFDDDVELAETAASEILQRTARESVVVHAGDSLSPYGVRFSSARSGVIVAALLEVPEHHYFLDEDRAWLVAVSFEGDLDILDQLHELGGLADRP